MHTPLLTVVMPAVLLFAKSDSGGMPAIEAHMMNAAVEIVGADGEPVSVDDPSRATVRRVEGRFVVEAARPADGGAIRLHVARQASLVVTTSNGAIRISGVSGAMRLTTSNGEIVVKGEVVPETHAHTSNGRIDISVPRNLNAMVSAHTSNGRIRSTVEVAASRAGANFLEGKIGSGGGTLDLQTSNGSICIRTAGDREAVDSTFRPGEVK